MLERAPICSLCIQVLDEFPLNLAQSMERIKKVKTEVLARTNKHIGKITTQTSKN